MRKNMSKVDRILGFIDCPSLKHLFDKVAKMISCIFKLIHESRPLRGIFLAIDQSNGSKLMRITGQRLMCPNVAFGSLAEHHHSLKADV